MWLPPARDSRATLRISEKRKHRRKESICFVGCGDHLNIGEESIWFIVLGEFSSHDVRLLQMLQKYALGRSRQSHSASRSTERVMWEPARLGTKVLCIPTFVGFPPKREKPMLVARRE